MTVYYETAGDPAPLCRGCGSTAKWNIVFAIGPHITPEVVALCDVCTEELGNLAEQRRLLVQSRPMPFDPPPRKR